MSFMLTTRQFRARTKDTTRRNGWLNAKPGQIVEAVEKARGVKAADVQRLGRIKFAEVSREKLSAMTKDLDYGRAEVIREGFPDLTPRQFVKMYCKANKCRPSQRVTRIVFRYL